MGWRVELWWRGDLIREEIKWRCDWVMRRVDKVEMIFLYHWRWESGWSRRVADNGGMNSMFQFWLERGGNIVVRWSGPNELVLAPMRRKCDTAWWHWLEQRQHQRGKKEGDSVSWTDAIFTGLKIKKIHVIDLFVINGRWRFKTMMS
jgi:hypothetical protein